MTLIKKVFSFLLLVIAASCIDPYIPNLRNFKSMLVVEGLISNENSSYKIKLSKTFKLQNTDPEKVIDAYVYITDGDGIKTVLQNCNNGSYKTDSTSFRGTIGQKYTLHILTSDGKEYKSEECTMLNNAGIDNLNYEKGQEVSGNPGVLYTGLRILLNSAATQGEDQYYRWTFEEVWKTLVPGSQRYTYTWINATTCTFRAIPDRKEICWKRNYSGDILTNSVISAGQNNITQQEIQFIKPILSDRLTKEYSILVKQYSISKKEFEFWNNLKKTGEAGGDIFASQPYAVINNIHNVNDASEMVPGYFEVSALSQKRIFIPTSELDPLHLPQYRIDCTLINKSPDDYPEPKPTWDEIYHEFVDNGHYTFVYPIATAGTVLEGKVLTSSLIKFVFSSKACSMCESPGFTTKPDYWIDL